MWRGEGGGAAGATLVQSMRRWKEAGGRGARLPKTQTSESGKEMKQQQRSGMRLVRPVVSHPDSRAPGPPAGVQQLKQAERTIDSAGNCSDWSVLWGACGEQAHYGCT